MLFTFKDMCKIEWCNTLMPNEMANAATFGRFYESPGHTNHSITLGKSLWCYFFHSVAIGALHDPFSASNLIEVISTYVHLENLCLLHLIHAHHKPHIPSLFFGIMCEGCDGSISVRFVFMMNQSIDDSVNSPNEFSQISNDGIDQLMAVSRASAAPPCSLSLIVIYWGRCRPSVGVRCGHLHLPSPSIQQTNCISAMSAHRSQALSRICRCN